MSANPAHINQIVSVLEQRMSATGAHWTAENIKDALDEDSYNTLVEAGYISKLIEDNGRKQEHSSVDHVKQNLKRFGLHF